jgi:hypothetical protein
MSETWQYVDEALRHGIRVAKAGGRVNIDEGTTEEDRLLRLIRVVEQSAYTAGRLSVRECVKSALGIVP